MAKFEVPRSLRSKVIGRKPQLGHFWVIFGKFSKACHFLMVRDRKLTFGDLIDLDTNSNLHPHLVQNMATRRRCGVFLSNLKSQIPVKYCCYKNGL